MARHSRVAGTAARLAVLAIAVLAAACGPSNTGRGTEPGQIGAWGSGSGTLYGSAGPGGLEPLFRSLRALENGTIQGPVAIVQIGDSHTAGDYFSGRLRARFQERFGGAGRGMMGPGVPFPFFEPTLVEVSQTDGWTLESSFTSNPTGVFALTGYRITADEPDAVATLVTTESAGFDFVQIETVRRPGGGTLVVDVDGQEVYRLATDGPTLQAARLDLPLDRPGRRLSVHPAGDGPVTLISWLTQRDRPGIVLDSHGIVGASINIIGHWDAGTVQWELASRNPALVILAYGTNEGFQDDLEAPEYRQSFTARLAQIEAAAPNAAILVVGPPDADRLPQACREDLDEPLELSCRPLDAQETANYARLFGADASGDACRWHPPPNLAVVRSIQREVALSRGHYFWDWSQVMGGACGLHAWATDTPPLAHSDVVHMRPAGYARSADALFNALMAAYGG
ncbi:MAG: hypothetical protein H6843_15700 [Rhodospirillaceae bacterium]|nr:hypothetical protein [Rhodospirillaceae bacterium]